MTTHSYNGGVNGAANLQANGDFYTVYTVIGEATGSFGDPATPSNAQNLTRLVEAFETLTNMNYVSVSSAVIDLSVSGNRTIYGLGTNFNQAATTVYTVKFFAPQTAFATATTLKALIQGLALPNPTLAVPHASAPADQTAYETLDAAEKNISITSVNIG